MNVDLQGIGAVASDAAIEFSVARANEAVDAAAARRAGNPREVDVAAQRRTDDNNLAWLR